MRYIFERSRKFNERMLEIFRFLLGYRFEVLPIATDFSTAVDDCAMMGGGLALPSSAGVEAEILRAIYNHRAILDPVWQANSSGVHNGAEQKMVWIDLQEDVSDQLIGNQEYKNYRIGQPNNDFETCVGLSFSGRDWCDMRCDRNIPYVCQFAGMYSVSHNLSIRTWNIFQTLQHISL